MSAHILIDEALESLAHASSTQEEALIVQGLITQFLIDQTITLKEFDHYCARLNKVARKEAA
ncbi:hypothetical protein ACW9I6_21910 [Pseudomonas sp. SDO5522_S412]|jgi:hypothetical protein|uniref:Uncharacterized protein n=1 Tax=Pseudomonas yamanorum TaxID=515393 RepID=A0AAJ3H8I8_9PSED|nr:MULTISPECIES: hypothetical protein [Pseudomonas]NWB20121.1 hypothetical protein [Pseudomonas sp. D4002]NWD44205.1 hypothetical protein [Pseudomonas yamanorum]